MKRKRTRRSRIRGRRSCGMGVRNNLRGKGSYGGKGMAGTGKRAGQKKTWVLKCAPGYFGKRGFTSLKQKATQARVEEINLDDLQHKLQEFIKEGKAKKAVDGTEITLENYKILSRGEVNEKLFVKASAFSEKAKEKIAKAGGSATVI